MGVVVVTGASSGIGEAVARRLVADGHVVVGLARRQERLDALSDELEGFHGMATDITDAAAVAERFARVRGTLGPVSALVANAGVGEGASMLQGGYDDWAQQLHVNALAPFVCAREALQDLEEGGQIVFMGSMSGHRVPTGAGMYAASKFALRAGVQALRQELRAAGRSVRVAHISPGVVETRFGLDDTDPSREEVVGFVPLQAEDIADIVAYVLAAPAHVDICDVLVRPTAQKS